ncbi:MAG: M14 family zinc carboxypeptidase [Cyclobacteriaceae bacterium]
MKNFAVLFFFCWSALFAQVKPPAEFHGYELGTTYTITANHYEYYKELAKSPRVQHVTYGKSIQNRPLVQMIISSEANLARLDEIKANNRKLTRLNGPLAQAEREALIKNTPAILYIFIVDTDEEAGTEVLSEVAYDLATKEDAATKSVRDNLVVIFSPLTNPDAHARYVTWQGLYDVKGASIDQNAVENRAHWGMNTDGNAVGVDVNRDFSFFVTPEMSALGKTMMDWRPNLILDVHSGPNTHFIPPFSPPYHDLWPDKAYQWWVDVAEVAGKRFGEKGWSLFSRNQFDGVTHVGFGLSWAMLGPSLSSFLFETFGGRPGRSTAFVRSDGTLATMRMAMDRHAEGAWALMETAASRKAQLMEEVYQAQLKGWNDAAAGSVKQIIIPNQGDPDKVNRMLQRLQLQDIEVKQASADFSATVNDYLGISKNAKRNFKKGDYLIDVKQPQSRLVRALFDPTVDDGDPRTWVPAGRNMPFYDVTWNTFPLIFGVEAFYTGTPVSSSTQQTITTAKNQATAPAKAYAYIATSDKEANYKLVMRMAQEGYKWRVFKSWFKIGNTVYPKGTFAAIGLRNPEHFHSRLTELVSQYGAEVVTATTPFTDGGVTFGDDDRLAPIAQPKVAVVADWPVMQDHYFGGIRTVLERDYDFAFSPVMLETLNRGDLTEYTTIVLPNAGLDIRGGPGFSRGYKGVLQLDNLRKFVNAGGTLVVSHGAAEVIANDEVLGKGVTFTGYAEYSNGTILKGEFTNTESIPTDMVRWQPGMNEVGKSLLANGYDIKFMGLPAAYPVVLKPDNERDVVLRYSSQKDQLLLDGFMLDEEKTKLAGAPYLVKTQVGKGHVIYFASDPTFRGYWYSLHRLFVNSLLFGDLE